MTNKEIKRIGNPDEICSQNYDGVHYETRYDTTLLSGYETGDTAITRS